MQWRPVQCCSLQRHRGALGGRVRGLRFSGVGLRVGFSLGLRDWGGKGELQTLNPLNRRELSDRGSCDRV